MARLLEVLFGCSHKNYSFPITIRGRRAGTGPRTYVVCLDCGREFAYDWTQMKVVANPGRETPGAMAQPAGSYATK